MSTPEAFPPQAGTISVWRRFRRVRSRAAPTRARARDHAGPDSGIDVSVILPSYNEAENLPSVVEEIVDELETTALRFEILIVDDGSKDGTRRVAHRARAATRAGPRAAAAAQPRQVRTRCRSGLREATGRRIVLMDADGQDDPAAIPDLLRAARRRPRPRHRSARRSSRPVRQAQHLEAVQRDDRARHRRRGPRLQQRPEGDDARRRRLARALRRAPPLHPGARGVERVRRSARSTSTTGARLHGESKFKRARFWRGFFDLVTVKFLTTYTARPFHLFGGVGIALSAVGSGMSRLAALHEAHRARDRRATRAVRRSDPGARRRAARCRSACSRS